MTIRLWRNKSSAWMAGCIFFLLAAGAHSEPPARPGAPKSGIEYAGAELHRLQADDAANPGMLWVTRGEALWNEAAGDAEKSCAQCHGAAALMKGVATRYPRVDEDTKKPVNLEGRINLCRAGHQRAKPFAFESADLLALTTYVAHQSRGMAKSVAINDQNRMHIERGAAFYSRRIGQMNLACTHCHDQHAGRTLLAEKISEGHTNAYPVYRLEWQALGSLQRRFRSCMTGVRAEPFAYGSEEYLSLELYLAWRGGGLVIETPGVRR